MITKHKAVTKNVNDAATAISIGIKPDLFCDFILSELSVASDFISKLLFIADSFLNTGCQNIQCYPIVYLSECFSSGKR